MLPGFPHREKNASRQWYAIALTGVSPVNVAWGVPIPVFYDEETNEPLLTEETIDYVKAIVAEKGSDAWWELSVEELLPEQYRNNGRTYRKGTDTMDVWFDSGSSWAAVAKGRNLKYPVDMYLEGSDQHRGWFQSSFFQRGN